MAITISPSQYRNYGTQGQEGSKKAAAEPAAAAKQSAAAQSLAKAMPGVVQLDKKQSPEDTAAAILRHVENGINQLRTQGADQSRIDQRLQARVKVLPKDMLRPPKCSMVWACWTTN